MHAMLLEVPAFTLRHVEFQLPECGDNDIFIKVNACGVCRTDLLTIE